MITKQTLLLAFKTALLPLVVLLSPNATASLLTFDFAATIRSIVVTTGSSDNLAILSDAGVGLGTVVTGNVVYDVTVPDNAPDTDTGRFLRPIVALQFTAGTLQEGFDTRTGAANSSVIIVQDGVLGSDTFNIQAETRDGLPGLMQTLFELRLRSSNNLWDTDQMPASLPSLSMLDPFSAADPGSTSINLVFIFSGSGIITARAEISALTQVPLPPAAILMLSALWGLGRLRNP
ncbi:MAG: hypothetical protein AAF610_08515 [Pseudomonadota bacterium]